MNRHVTVVLAVMLAAPIAAAQNDSKKPLDARLRALTAEGARYLVSAQEKEGGWASQTGPGITCLVLKALIEDPSVGPKHAAVQRGLKFVAGFQRDDGGIYSAEGLLKNYETSVALSLLSLLAKEEFGKRVAAAQSFLIDNQWDENENISVDDPIFGGSGYGKHERPDLSNTQMMLEALHDSGMPKTDPVYKKAIAFISRCQMLGESNDQDFAQGSTDGGFIYTPYNGGESKAGKGDVNGRLELRSYGSMTYAGFKSLLYAGLKKDDPRVVAAMDWIRRHWTLDYNPNMPGKRSLQGLYYYYHVFARAMQAWGQDEIVDKAARKHNWRRELVEKLAKLQRRDGSWVNEADRWQEGFPPLTTAYAMLALHAATGDKP